MNSFFNSDIVKLMGRDTEGLIFFLFFLFLFFFFFFFFFCSLECFNCWWVDGGDIKQKILFAAG